MKEIAFNGLTFAEAERLALLLEELGEAQQAIGKILRHGYESIHPNGGPDNKENLEKEIGDVLLAIQLMTNNGDLSGFEIEGHKNDKRKKVAQYLHHQRRGCDD